MPKIKIFYREVNYVHLALINIIKIHLQFNFIISIVFTDLVSVNKIDLFIAVKVTKMADKTNSSLHVV